MSSPETGLPVRKAIIATTEPWHPGSGYEPPLLVTDESFSWVISDMGRDGVTWLRVHIKGYETWINLANVISITQESSDD